MLLLFEKLVVHMLRALLCPLPTWWTCYMVTSQTAKVKLKYEYLSLVQYSQKQHIFLFREKATCICSGIAIKLA